MTTTPSGADALREQISDECVKAWEESTQSASEFDAVHPMFIDAFHRGFYAALSAAQEAPAAWPIAPDISADLERSDWTPEEALLWYAAGKHYDTVPNGDGTSSARILDNGAVASNALKSLSREYAEHKGDVALQEAPAQAMQAVPGWQLVPVEPTDEMEEAARISQEASSALKWTYGDCYRAMIASAPAAPQPAEPDSHHWTEADKDRLKVALTKVFGFDLQRAAPAAQESADALDSELLNWMIFYSARLRHGNDGEFCQCVWFDEDGEHHSKLFGNARDAIRAAIAAQEASK